jgi:hypothetical protein
MPSSSPLPQTREDVAIHAFKGGFTQHVPMIVGPTANLRVELIDQIGGRHAPCVLDDSSDAIQEGSNILLGRLDGQFPVRVAAQRSPKKSTDCTTVGVCAKGIKKELNTLDEPDFVRDVANKFITIYYDERAEQLHVDGSLRLRPRSDERHVLGTACVLSFGQIPQREYLRLRIRPFGSVTCSQVSSEDRPV